MSSGLSSADLSVCLEKHSDLLPELIPAVLSAYESRGVGTSSSGAGGEEGEAEEGAGDSQLSIGRLVGSHWTLGVSTGNSWTAAAEGSQPWKPYIQLQLQLSDDEGGIAKQQLRLSLEAFTRLYASMREMGERLDGL